MLHESSPRKTIGKKIGYGVLTYLGIILALVFILIFFTNKFENSVEPESNGFSLLSATDQPALNASEKLVPDHSPMLGPDDAKITIVEFSDFSCPFCKASFPIIRQLLNKYPNDLRLVYRHMPLKSIHPLAEELAHASMCAKEQGKFWVMHDRLFQNQDSVTEENIVEQARAVGLAIPQFTACHESGRWENAIQQDLADAVHNGGRGTPTWLVNGQLVQGTLPLSTWETIIDQLLASD